MKPTPEFDPKAAAKKLMREARSGALGTLMAGTGDPYCSLVNVATQADGTPLLLISRLAVHTRNILADPRASLMLDERKDAFAGIVRRAMEAKLGDDAEEALKVLSERGISRQLAKRANISGRSKMGKAQLVRAVGQKRRSR